MVALKRDYELVRMATAERLLAALSWVCSEPVFSAAFVYGASAALYTVSGGAAGALYGACE